ncbi:MAG: AsmA family protein [Lentisphaeria bacterium]
MKKRRRHIIKYFLISLAALAVILLIVGIVVTRPFFVKRVVIPRIENATGLTIDIEKLSISPFSRIELENLRVSSPQGPLIENGTVEIEYEFWKLLDKQIAVSKIVLHNGDITMTQNADGSWHIPIPAKPEEIASPRPEKRHPESTPSFLDKYQLIVSEVDIQNISVRFKRKSKDQGTTTEINLRDMSIEAENIASESEATVAWHGIFSMNQADTLTIENARITGNAKIGLSVKSGTGSQVYSKGQLEVQELAPQHPNIKPEQVAPLSLSLQYEGEFQSTSQSLSLQTLESTVTSRDRKVAEFILEKPARISVANAGSQEKPAHVRVAVDKFDLAPWMPILRSLNIDIPFHIKKALFSTTTQAVINDLGRNVSVQTESSLDNVDMTFEDTETSNISFHSNVNAKLSDYTKLKIPQMTVTMEQADQPVIVVKCENANINLSDMSGRSSYAIPLFNIGLLQALPLNSLDDVPLTALRGQAEGEVQFDSLIDPASDQGSQADENDKTKFSPVQNLDVSMKFLVKNLQYADLQLTECQGSASLHQGVVELSPTEFYLNGSAGNIQGSADLLDTLPSYQGSLSLNKLAISPLVRSFVPDSSDISGEVETLKLDAESSGKSQLDILENLILNSDIAFNNIEAIIDPSRIDEIPGLNIVTVPLRILNSVQGQGLLSRVSAELRTLAQSADEVMAGRSPMKFTSGEIKLDIQDGHAIIKECRFTGDPVQQIRVQGSTDLLAGLSRQQEVAMLPEFNPALNLQVVFGLLGETFSVPVQGRMRNPQWSHDGIVKNLVKSFGSRMLQETLKKVGEGEKFDLKDILQGTFTPGKKSDTPSDKQNQEETQASPEHQQEEQKPSAEEQIMKQLLEGFID